MLVWINTHQSQLYIVRNLFGIDLCNDRWRAGWKWGYMQNTQLQRVNQSSVGEWVQSQRTYYRFQEAQPINNLKGKTLLFCTTGDLRTGRLSDKGMPGNAINHTLRPLPQL